MKTIFKNANWFSRFLILSICFLIITLPEVVSQTEKARLIQSNENKLIIAVDISSYKDLNIKKINTTLEQHVANGGDYLIDSLGKPNVPVIISKISVPNGKNPSIKITPGEPVVFDDIDLTPVQEPLMDCECERKYKYDSVVYKTDDMYPGKLAECKRVKNKRGYKFSDLYMYPYQYNPVQKKLFIYPEMLVTVEFKGSHQAIRKSLKSQRVENFIRNHTVNGEKILQNES